MGKVRDQDCLILFDSDSNCNFISQELASKLGIHAHEMGLAMEADGAFDTLAIPVTPLIGKLRLHVQGYVDQEDFFISPLKHQDVLLGAPWFHRMATTIKFPDRVIFFNHRGRDITLEVNEKGHTIPLVSQDALHKSIKSTLSAYLIFFKDSMPQDNSLSSNEKDSSKEESSLKLFLDEYDDCFIDSIPTELPPSRGEDDHKIELIPGSSPPNKPPYRVSLA